MKDVLGIYENCSDQVLNKENSFILFSPHIQGSDKDMVIKATGGTICRNYEKYLGLLAIVGRFKYNTFKSIKEKV